MKKILLIWIAEFTCCVLVAVLRMVLRYLLSHTTSIDYTDSCHGHDHTDPHAAHDSDTDSAPWRQAGGRRKMACTSPCSNNNQVEAP